MKVNCCKIHKWLAVSAGVFILVWIVSGIAMIIPLPNPEKTRKEVVPARDFLEITISPREAVEKLANLIGELPPLRSVSLEPIAGLMVYKISTESGRSHLIDSQTVQELNITQELAEKIVRKSLSTPASVSRIDLITRHRIDYLWGPLPAYRIEFSDSRATVSYVAVADGTVYHNDRWSRFRSVMVSLHTLDPLNLITGKAAVRKGLLLLLGLLGIAAAGTGYYLALPVNLRRLRASGEKLDKTR